MTMHSKPTWQMKTRDHGTSECAMTIVNHVPIVKDISRTQHYQIAFGSFFNISPMVIVDSKKPGVFKLVTPLNQFVISPYACEQREGDDDDDDDGVDVAPAA
ncbi:hypothetical protein Peur_051043 [Populus x canadensis]